MESNTIDFFSNDYLGFARNIEIKNRAEKLLEKEIIQKKGVQINGSTGSRLLSGNSSLAALLEAQLANHYKAESCLLYNAGYTANLGLLSCLAERVDTYVYDEYSHASIRDGINLSNAKKLKFKHNDVEDLTHKLKLAKGNTFVIVESIYSMDGDRAPLVEISKCCRSFGALLIVDEAHSTGIIGLQGEGAVVSLNLQDVVFARVHTFGKAIGVHGAAVVGSKTLKEYLVNFSRPFIYTTGNSSHDIVSLMAAHEYLQTAKQERSALKRNIDHLNVKLNREIGDSPILSLIIPGNKNVKEVADRLENLGFGVRPILSPTVPEGTERLRICLHAFNTENQIDALLNAIG